LEVEHGLLKVFYYHFDLRQSSGKSSILESIVGRDFFPQGSGKTECSFTVLFRIKKNDTVDLRFGLISVPEFGMQVL
jgi:hypothetical protein